MSLSKHCIFRDDWLESTDFSKWLQKKNDLTARCSICHTDISLSNMGINALKSHMKGAKHIKLSENMSKVVQSSVDTFFKKSTSASTTTTTSVSSSISAVQKAEVIWCLKTAMSHYSFRSASDLSTIFPMMFPNCPTATQFSLSYDKLSYFINFGLYPVIHRDLVSMLRNVRHFSVSFDESLNGKVQKQQMDLHVKFWDESKEMVATRYFNSVFMGYATAKDIHEKFLECLNEVQMKKILQVSMDGPNVNWAFLDLLHEEFDPRDPQLIETGSCSIHILNNAFKKGAAASQWNIKGLLRCSYLLFHDSPARRADFLKIIGVSAVFPLKFCGHRWLENRPVLERLIQIWPDMVKYVRSVPEDKILKSHVKDSQAFQVIKAMVDDPLVVAKLNFCLMMTMPFHDILRTFQSEFPLLPFLYDAVDKLLKSLMKKVVKPEVIESSVNICSIDVDNRDNLMKISDTEVGTAALTQLVNPNLNKKIRLTFHSDAQVFIVTTIKSIQQKNPMMFKFVKNCRSVSPSSILQHPDECKKGMKKIVVQLHEANRLSSVEADLAMDEFSNFLSTVVPMHRERLESFVCTEHRIDVFYKEIFGEEANKFSNFKLVMKMIFTMFHGNAAVERGFSVSGDTRS